MTPPDWMNLMTLVPMTRTGTFRPFRSFHGPRSDVRHHDPGITLEEVKGIVKKPNPEGIAATLAVALAYSPLYLLLDKVFSYGRYNTRLNIFHLWKAAGNSHRLDLTHPLGQLERILWLLILCVVAHKLQPEDVPRLFFENVEVQAILASAATSNEAYEDALVFQSDLLLAPTLLAVDPDDDDHNYGIPLAPAEPLPATERGEPPTKKQRIDPPPHPPPPPSTAGVEQAPAHDDAPAAETPTETQQAAGDVPAADAPLPQPAAAVTSAGDVPTADAAPAPPAGAFRPEDGAPPNAPPNAPPAGAAPAAVTSAGSHPSAAVTTSTDGGTAQMEDANADDQSPNKTRPRKPRRKNDEEEDVAPRRSERIGEKAAEAAAAPPAVPPAHPPIGDQSRARPKPRHRLTTTKPHQRPVPSAIKWLDVRPGFQPPVPDESLYLQELYHDHPEKRLDTSADHAFAKHRPIAVGDPENGYHIEFEHGVYNHRFFEGSAAQSKVLQSLVGNQYTVADENGLPIPISQTPESLATPTLDAPPPGTELSKVWIGHSEEWRCLSPKVQQNLLRTRGAQIVHTAPAVGRDYKFDVEMISAFTNPERLASIQDNGAREPGHAPQNFVGRPSDLIKCASKADAQRNDPPPARGQALNLLSNLLPETSLPLSDAWEHIATHEFACRFLRGSTALSRFEFLWKEVSWGIFATGGAMSDTHIDVLLTIIMILCGSKIWTILHRRPGLPDTELRGLMRSRKAFTDFDAANPDPEIFAHEILYLDPHSILILPATFPHWVITENHSAAIGRHGIANSNLTNCILTSLHNVMLAHVTTNADHEPAREFCYAFFYSSPPPLSITTTCRLAPIPRTKCPRPTRQCKAAHARPPNHFIILYVPLMSCQPSDVPRNWRAAALGNLIVMAVSLIHYHRDSLIDHDPEDLEREPKFSTENFTFQIRQAIAHFDIREMWYNHHHYEGPEPAYEPDTVLTEKELEEIYTVQRLNFRLESNARSTFSYPGTPRTARLHWNRLSRANLKCIVQYL
ncbi:hypothetical protein B0H13DRAFT_1849540 [Mycena leptocephala]|nr:hypothetical protein B0H13DRAFT_1849540 [Mycena leptocephala]